MIFIIFLLQTCQCYTYAAVSERITSSLKLELSSLVFVFDVTGSMSNELDQVKFGASEIFNELTKKKDTIIHDFILVQFNDPVVGPSMKTDNATIFKEALQELKVSGGLDCPEMSLTALYEGLRVSLPGSFIFVFTDADPKDVNLLPDILFFIRAKNSQIIFVLTGTCVEGQTSEAFQKIASLSTGQIFSLLKNDVHFVLDFIRLSLRSRRVSLLAVDCPNETNSVKQFNIPVDETVSEIVISVSGKQIGLTVVDPSGITVNNSSNFNVVLSLDKMKICSVQKPKLGIWKLIVSSVSSYSLRTSAISNMTFTYGFQTDWSLFINGISPQPFKGIKNFVFLKPNNSSVIANVVTCEILALNGTLIHAIQLHRFENSSDLYFGSFTPISLNFHVQIKGITKFGHIFQRVGLTSAVYLDSSVNVNPMPVKQIVSANQSFNLTCEIYSSIPYIVQWWKNGINLNRTKHFSKSEKVEFIFPKISVSDAGNYTCLVVGTYQNDTAMTATDLRVFELPVINDTYLSEINLKETEDYALFCSVKGFPPPKLRWFYNNSVEIMRGLNFEHLVILPDFTLLLLNSQLNQTGLYSCVAANEYGIDKHNYQVTVTGDAEIDSSLMNVKVLEGDKVALSCPETENNFHVQWLKNSLPLDMKPNERADEPRYVLLNGGKKLRILNVYRDDSGFYTCVISTLNETSEYHIFLSVLIPPSFRNLEDTLNLSVFAGKNVTFDCAVEGIPKPHVTWRKSNLDFPVNQWTVPNVTLMYPEKQILQIHHIYPKYHSGIWECAAKNEVGSIKRSFALNIVQQQ